MGRFEKTMPRKKVVNPDAPGSGGTRTGSGRKKTPAANPDLITDDGEIGMSPDKVPEPDRYHCTGCDGVLSLRDLKCAGCGIILDWSGVV